MIWRKDCLRYTKNITKILKYFFIVQKEMNVFWKLNTKDVSIVAFKDREGDGTRTRDKRKKFRWNDFPQMSTIIQTRLQNTAHCGKCVSVWFSINTNRKNNYKSAPFTILACYLYWVNPRYRRYEVSTRLPLLSFLPQKSAETREILW